jgi:hypothetical protein
VVIACRKDGRQLNRRAITILPPDCRYPQVEHALFGFKVLKHLRMDGRMHGDNGYPAFRFNLKRVKIPGTPRWMECDMNRSKDLMNYLPRISEANGDYVVAFISLVKNHAMERRTSDPLGFDTSGLDYFQFHDCANPLLADQLAEILPVGAVYFMYHVFDF